VEGSCQKVLCASPKWLSASLQGFNFPLKIGKNYLINAVSKENWRFRSIIVQVYILMHTLFKFNLAQDMVSCQRGEEKSPTDQMHGRWVAYQVFSESRRTGSLSP
jgi:hypothetical protein